MTELLSLDEFREQVNSLLDQWEEQNKEFVAVVGNLTGAINTRAPSTNNPTYRLDTNLGYHEQTFASRGVESLHGAINYPMRNVLAGTMFVPRDELSSRADTLLDTEDAHAFEDLEEPVEEGQQQLAIEEADT